MSLRKLIPASQLAKGRYWGRVWPLVMPPHPTYGGEARLHVDSLGIPVRARKPAVWWVVSDLFHPCVPDTFIDRALASMVISASQIFLLESDYPERMRDYLSRNGGHDGVPDHVMPLIRQMKKPTGWKVPAGTFSHWPSRNIWIGTRAQTQIQADVRIPALLQTPGTYRYVNLQPRERIILEKSWLPYVFHCPVCGWAGDSLPENLESPCCDPCPECGNTDFRGQRFEDQLNWVISGGGVGPNAKPLHPYWVRSLRDQCHKAGARFLFRGWGTFAPCRLQKINGAFNHTNGHDHYELDQTCNGPMRRVGPHRSGRLLDGFEHLDFPMTWDEIQELQNDLPF